MQINFKKFFTPTEITYLLISILAIALILSFPDLKTTFFVTLMIVLFSVLIRELGHKLMANRLGCMATYKIWPIGILFGLMSMFLRPMIKFVFVAVGYTEIMPYKFGRLGIKLIKLSPRDTGVIALAGVGLNVFLGILFSIFSGDIFHTISRINGILAVFNLIPIPDLDGYKIFGWSIWLWVFLFLVSIIILVI